MSALSVLKDVEDFLRKDLAGEVLSTRTKTKRSILLDKVTVCIAKVKEESHLDNFLARQREVSRAKSSGNNKKNLSDEDDGDYYMDLTEIAATPGFQNNNSSPPVTESCGSGSGYESYASDDETLARPKSSKEEDLSVYFSSAECDIFTYIYIENKSKFLKGKKWLKRIGIVRENHLKFYKKPTDSSAVLDIPLRGYNTTLKNKASTTWIIVILSTVSDGEAYRFHVERDHIDEWSKVLREKTLSVTDEANLPPPPVAARPVSTLPRLPTQATTGIVQHSPIQRTPSTGTPDRAKSLGDIALSINDCNPPPVPPRHPSLSPQNAPSNHISKGLKSAMTDMFKKDKTKKKIMMAENLGANVCGHLMVFDIKWVKKWCLINRNQLLIYGKEEAPELQIQLQGCDLLPYSNDPERPFGFKILKSGKECVYIEASSSDEMAKWVGVLIAETGCAEMPESAESEPEYMPIDVGINVMSTAKQAFDRQKQSMHRKAGKSTFFQADPVDEEDIYVDLDADGQIAPPSSSPRKIVSPPLPPSVGRTSKSHSITFDRRLPLENDMLSNDRRSALNASATIEEKVEKSSSDATKAKAKQRKKQNNARRHLTEPNIKFPIESKPSRDIKVIRDPLLPVDSEDDTPKNGGGKSVVDGIIEKRRKELMTQKAAIKTKLLTLSVKREELNKYIEATPTERDRVGLRIALQKATEDHSKLEKEHTALELELRKLKDKSYIDFPANKRPQSRKERKPINTGATGNVLSKAQMWEPANRK